MKTDPYRPSIPHGLLMFADTLHRSGVIRRPSPFAHQDAVSAGWGPGRGRVEPMRPFTCASSVVYANAK
jgi:hypothetical protein